MSRKTLLDNGAAESTSHVSTASLLDSEQEVASRSASHQRNSKFRDFLRHVRLLLPGNLLGCHSPWVYATEQRKVAAYQSRSMATLISLLYMIPLGGAMTLLALYWTKYWVGREPGVLTALQFLAKLHEILMQASLVDILVYFVRSQALEGYIPLGALSGAAQASQLSYLWSLEFVSAVGSPAFKVWRRVIFGLAVSTLLSIIMTVGPSAAILMIPRPGMANTNATTLRYFGVSQASLYPTDLNERYKASFNISDKPQSDSSVLGINQRLQWQLITYKVDDDRVWYHFAKDLPGQTPKVDTVITTIPTDLSSDLLNTHSDSQNWPSSPDLNLTALVPQSPQPLVLASCSHSEKFGDEDIYSIDKSKKLLVNPRALYENLILANLTLETAEWKKNPKVLWIPAADDPHTLVAMAPQGYRPTCTVCMVESFWWTAKTSLSFINGIRQIKPELPDHPQNLQRKDLRAIEISPALTDVSDNNGPSLSLDATDLADSIAWALAAVPRSRLEPIEGSRTPKEISDLSQVKNKSDITPFRIDVIDFGYGYGTRDLPTQLSVAIITAYCLIVVFYIGYVIATGHASVAWNSPTELIMLALQSKEPSDLGHVSVGIDSMETLRRSVGIRVRTVDIQGTGEVREKLELVFEHDEEAEKRELTKVARNKAY